MFTNFLVKGTFPFIYEVDWALYRSVYKLPLGFERLDD